MKPFRERNPIPIGVISLVVLLLAAVAAFNSEDLPIIGGGTSYTADIREAAGLKASDSVKVAGVKVGQIDDVEVEGDHVKVSFTVKDAFVGDQSEVAVKLQTFLGQKFLSVFSRGSSPMSPSKPMKEDTGASVFFDVQQAFNGLTDRVDRIDSGQLARSFGVLSNTFANTPNNVRGALQGLSALSKTISSRDDQLGNLLDNTRNISQTLADRNTEVQKLFGDGNLVLAEIQHRKEAIASLLRGTQELSVQLSGLVNDNNEQLRPVLGSLNQLTSLLQRNQDSLGEGIKRMAPFLRLFNNTLGNGRWFDNYICGLVPPALGPINTQGCLPPHGAASNGTGANGGTG
jgi:phospholipid/cholesterol/gamma-HCH transport system substrate-binding protein